MDVERIDLSAVAGPLRAQNLRILLGPVTGLAKPGVPHIRDPLREGRSPPSPGRGSDPTPEEGMARCSGPAGPSTASWSQTANDFLSESIQTWPGWNRSRAAVSQDLSSVDMANRQLSKSAWSFGRRCLALKSSEQ